jgi:hypothetical protein
LVVARKSEEEQEGQVEGRECNMELAIAFMKACTRSGTLIQMIGLGLSDFPLGPPLTCINLQWMERRRGNWTSMK